MRTLAILLLSFAAYAAPTCNAGWPSTSVPVTILGRFAYQGNSYRSGSSVTLNGTGSSGTGGLSYLWTQVPNLTTGIASAIVNGLPSTASKPVIGVQVPPGQTAAPLDISLTITDGTGNTTCYISDGVVATGDDGTVIVPAAVATIIGNPIQFQKDPWPLRDSATTDVLADAMGNYDLFQSGSPNYYTVVNGGWNTASTHGTVSVGTSYAPGSCPNTGLYGCFSIVGSGTQLDTDYCGGLGNTSLSGPYMVIWYKRADGSNGRMVISNGSCASPTLMYGSTNGSFENQSGGQWPGDMAGWGGISILGSASQANLQYSSTNFNGCTINTGSCWWWASEPFYYDPVGMFYQHYYRSGIDTYLWSARTLADLAWYGPFFDRGQSIAFGLQPACVNQVNCYALDIGGFILRAMDTSDGHADMWSGLEHLYYWNAAYLTTRTWFQARDARISGTAQMVLGYGALLDQSSGNYSTAWCPNCSTLFPLSSMPWAQFLRSAIHTTAGSFWGPDEDSIQHGWLTFIGSYPGHGGGFTSYDSAQSWSGKLATITTSGGTSTVTCTGCTWSSAMFTNKFEVDQTANVSSTPCTTSDPTCVHVPITFGPSAGSNSGSGDWDNQSYCQTGCSWDGTTLTLDRAYGTTGTYTVNWVFAVDNTGAISPDTPWVTVAGWGQDSFMGGHVLAGFLLSAQACAGSPTPAGCAAGDSATFTSDATDETNWLLTYTNTANTYGMSYFAGYPVCQSTPISATNYWCLSSNDNAVFNREILGDSAVGMIRQFISNPTTTMRTRLDDWFAGMWAKPGVGSPPLASPDGLWDAQFEADRSQGCTVNVSFPYITGCTNLGQNNAYWVNNVGVSVNPALAQKLSAQHFGISNEDTWPTHRLLGVAMPTKPANVQ